MGDGTNLLVALLVLVALAGKPDADAVRDVADALVPNVLVQVSVYPHILGAHHLGGELADGTDGARRLLLERAEKGCCMAVVYK